MSSSTATNPKAGMFFPENFDGDARLMIETAEQFSRNEVLPYVDAIDAQAPGLMPSLIRKAGELGLCGIDTAEAYGGLGLSKNLAARMLEFLSLNGSYSVTYGITSGISQVGLSLFGTEDQKLRWLPKLAAGEHIGAYCLSEPNSGSDALSATTRATPVDGGYRLSGTKMWISNAQWADVFLVMAKVDGEHFTAFLVPRTADGLVVEREEHKMGLKGSSTARVTLNDVFVPHADVLHEVGKGHQVAFNALNIGRFKLASMSIGPARYAMEVAAQYAQDRRQFGQPIANFGLIREKFARMAALFFAAESAIYRVGALIDDAFAETGGTVEGNRKAAEKYAIECALVKVFATEAEAEIVDEAVQVYGGYGFTEEFPVARIYRDARVSRIYEGTNEINRIFIAGRMAKAGLAPDVSTQTEQGAIADLAIYQFVEDSVRARAETYPEYAPLADAYLACIAGKRIAAGARLSRSEMPSLPHVDWEEIGAQSIARGGPWARR
jgi:alkylation response protein AidB-like acyl-CoA dehydrogenase